MFKIYLQDDINEEKGSLYIQLIKLFQILICATPAKTKQQPKQL